MSMPSSTNVLQAWQPENMNPPRTSFTSLPPEIRHRILSFTSLVAPSGPKFGWPIPGIHIRDGSLDFPLEHNVHLHTYPHCGCVHEPFEKDNLLFVPNEAFRADAHYVLFSKNRFAFYGDLTLNLIFLQKHRPWVGYIREVDFQFDPKDLSRWLSWNMRERPYLPWSPRTSHNPMLATAWSKIVDFVTTNIPLHNLTLSLDIWTAYTINSNPWNDDSDDMDLDDHEIIEPKGHAAIVEPLKGLGYKGLQSFYAYFAPYSAYEKAAEKLVMGEDYVAVNKIPSGKRHLPKVEQRVVWGFE